MHNLWMNHPSYKAATNRWSAFLETKPTPKGRARYANGRFYTPATTAKAELEIKHILARFNLPKLPGPLGVELVFNIAKPKTSKMDYPHWANDIDNLSKLVLDAMNDMAYDDDSHVTILCATKQFALIEGIQISVWQVIDDGLNLGS